MTLDINDLNDLYEDPAQAETADALPEVDENGDPVIPLVLESDVPAEQPVAQSPEWQQHLAQMQDRFEQNQALLYQQNQALQAEIAAERAARARANEPAPSEVDKLLDERFNKHTSPILEEIRALRAERDAERQAAARRAQVEAHARETSKAADDVLFKGMPADVAARLRAEAVHFGMTASAAYELPPAQALARSKAFLDAYADAKYKTAIQTKGAAVAQSRAAAPTVTSPNAVATKTEKRPITDADRAAVRDQYGDGPQGWMAGFADGWSKVKNLGRS